MLTTAVCDAHATRITTSILNKFPSRIEEFYDSVGYQVISRLSYTLDNLPFATGGKPDGLDDHLQHGKMALATLKELRELLQGKVLNKRPIVTKKDKRSPQLYRQSEPSANMEGAIQCFEALGLRFPRTRLSAEETTQKIIDTQRNVLKVRLPLLSTSPLTVVLNIYQFLFRAIRNREIIGLIRTAYLGLNSIYTSSVSERYCNCEIH